MSGLVAGRDAIRIMVEEIGAEIGARRTRVFEMRVRSRLPGGGTARQWIGVMAEVIVEEDDARANRGFMRGINRIRAIASQQ